jgi:hypothetical protein
VATITIAARLDGEAMEMLITPAQGCLQCGMQVGDAAVAADEQPSPDQRADAAQDHSKLVHDGLDVRGGLRHRAIIAPLPSSPVASLDSVHSPCSARAAGSMLHVPIARMLGRTLCRVRWAASCVRSTKVSQEKRNTAHD